MRLLWIFIFATPVWAADLSKEQAKTALNSHVVRQMEMWTRNLKRPFPKRIGPASPILNEFTALRNIAAGLPATEAADFGAKFRRTFAKLAQRLPPGLQKILDARLVGVFAVKGLGSAGFTQLVSDKSGAVVGGFIVIDIDIMKKNVNAWASERESAQFQTGEYRVAVKLAGDNLNNPQETTESILLREFISIIRPFVNIEPFRALSWTPPEFKVHKVAGRPTDLLNARVPEAYAWLEKTNFPTWAASQSVEHDFVESMASWARLKKLGKPYSLSVSKGDKVVQTYLSCWSGARCADKAKFFETLWK